ncbi:MAG: DUF2303 family protein [Pseudonocardia sp.]
MTDIDNVQTIVNTAVRSTAPAELEPGRIYAFNTPTGVHKLDLTGPEHTGIPSRKSGTTVVRDTASWLTYWAKHADADSEVYADAETRTVTAVLDAHTAGGPRFGGHRLALQLRLTDAWSAWRQHDGQLLPQASFAEHLEDHLPELLEPDAATMLEIAQSFQATTKAEFTSGVRLQSGERQFVFKEEARASAGRKGELTIPETFIVGLVPFEGAQGYRLTARLRYRIHDGQLRIGYKLERPMDVLTEAFADVRQYLDEHIEVAVMNGSPAR